MANERKVAGWWVIVRNSIIEDPDAISTPKDYGLSEYASECPCREITRQLIDSCMREYANPSIFDNSTQATGRYKITCQHPFVEGIWVTLILDFSKQPPEFFNGWQSDSPDKHDPNPPCRDPDYLRAIAEGKEAEPPCKAKQRRRKERPARRYRF